MCGDTRAHRARTQYSNFLDSFHLRMNTRRLRESRAGCQLLTVDTIQAVPMKFDVRGGEYGAKNHPKKFTGRVV
jgi:hypothetical protein